MFLLIMFQLPFQRCSNPSFIVKEMEFDLGWSIWVTFQTSHTHTTYIYTHSHIHIPISTYISSSHFITFTPNIHSYSHCHRSEKWRETCELTKEWARGLLLVHPGGNDSLSCVLNGDEMCFELCFRFISCFS